jgi:hypothetical protein
VGHTFIQADNIPKTTFSYSGELKMWKSFKISRRFFFPRSQYFIIGATYEKVKMLHMFSKFPAVIMTLKHEN